MIRKLGRSLGNAVLETVGRASSRIQSGRPLPVDLLESEDAYLAVFDAPGATSSDIQVRFENNTVEVRIDRFRDFHEGFEMRLPGRGLSLDGSITLHSDAGVDPNEASATLRRNGTLEVRVPKDDSTHEMEVTEEEDLTESDDVDVENGASDGEDADVDDDS
jgi:HSP20 family molecular chaperone IbpA